MKYLMWKLALALVLVPATLWGQQQVPILSGAVTIPAGSSTSFSVTMNQNITSFTIAGPPAPVSSAIQVIFTQDSTGGRTFAGQASNISGSIAPTSTANASTAYQFAYNSLNNNWTVSGGSGGGTPGGLSGQVQYNNSGAFGGAANLTYNATSGLSTLALADKGGQVYNVKAYGAVGNGVLLYNCAITTATAALTCSTASFTSADVGKAIEVDGAAASAGNIVTTITAFTDATHVTIGSNAATTTSTANVVYGTDDSVAIQTLVNSVISSGGGTLFFPIGLYILAGTPSATNFMIEIPAQNTNGTVPMSTIGFAGGAIPTASGAKSSPPVSTGTLYGMEQVVAGGGLLGADPFGGSFSQINVVVSNLQIVTPPNPNFKVLRLLDAYNQTVENVNLLANKPPNNALPPTPTSTQGEALQFGGDAGIGLAINVYVQGIYTGFDMQDHSTCINCYAQSPFIGFLIAGGSHTRNILGGLVQNASRGLDLRTSTRLMAQVDFETNTTDIFVDGSNIKGFVVADDPGASIASKMNATSPFLFIQDENAGYIGASILFTSYTFATLPPVVNALQIYCSDCKNAGTDGATFDSVAVGAGTGTTVLGENGAWRVH